MQFAVNEKNERIHISDTSENEKYFCPSCGYPVIQRHGQVNIEHFAHAKGYLCNDNWHYEEMSEWHRNFQNRYPSECQEYVMTSGMDKHRADVFINDTVIEFQHSPISAEEFQERNEFYTGLGYRVVWLFDAREAFDKTLFADESNPDLYHWKYAPKTLKGLDLHSKIHIYFQIKDQENDEGTILRLTWCPDGDLNMFSTNSDEYYSEAEFVAMTSFGRKTINRPRNSEINRQLTHSLYAVRRKNGDLEYFGCPVNKDGYAPMIQEYSRHSCDNCKYCVEYDNVCVRCCARYSSIIEDVESIIDMTRYPDDETVFSVEYINTEGDIQKFIPDVPVSPANTLLDLSEEYDAGILIVRNIRKGNKYKITKPVAEYLNKYHKVYGYYWNEKYASWSKNSTEIFYALKPEWIVEWFKTKKETEYYRNTHK